MIKKPYINENEALERKIETATLGIFAFVCFAIAVVFEAMR